MSVLEACFADRFRSSSEPGIQSPQSPEFRDTGHSEFWFLVSEFCIIRLRGDPPSDFQVDNRDDAAHPEHDVDQKRHVTKQCLLRRSAHLLAVNEIQVAVDAV